MKVLTFGEIMLRLKAPGHERFFQSPMLEATFGGSEANVAVSLANYGMDVEFLTVLPKNDIADACIRELRYFGVDTKKIVRGDGRRRISLSRGRCQRVQRSLPSHHPCLPPFWTASAWTTASCATIKRKRKASSWKQMSTPSPSPAMTTRPLPPR